MAIDDRVGQVMLLLRRVSNYNRLIVTDSFEVGTIDDMKGNAKDICDAVKDEIDNIKAEIDQWGS